MLWATALSGSDEPTGRHLNLARLVQVLDLPEARAKEQRIGMVPSSAGQRSSSAGMSPWGTAAKFCSVVCTSRSEDVLRFIGGRKWTPAFVTHVQGLGVAHLYRDINTTKIIARTKAGDHIIARIRKFV